MSYQSLYRRYRPSTFGEVVGQRHVITALKNAIREDRVGHAYLFSGPRGTGKTTSARLLGKALNCTNLSEDSEPCNTCESCESFLNGTSYDLHELDAASNNGVENVRDLINKVALGSPGQAKVYILDEVHMLSTGAENALLKTLEEPPDHVTFVLCTTEPHKVVPTIRSRTQHYEFELLPAEDLIKHVHHVSDDADLGVTDEMVDYVIRAGGGSARDTLSALDQVVAAGGIPRNDDTVGTILTGLSVNDSGAVMMGVSEALQSGRDPRVIGETLLGRLRDAFLSSMSAPLHQLSEAQIQQANDLAGVMGPASITRALEVIGSSLVDMRQAPDPRVDLEVALLRLSRPDLDTDLPAVVARLERLEAGGVPAPAVAAAAAQAPAAPAAPSPVPAQAAAPPAQAAVPPAQAAVVGEPAAVVPAAEQPAPVVDGDDSGAGGPAAAARAMLAARQADAAGGGGSSDRPTLGARRREQSAATPPAEPAAETPPASPAPKPGAPVTSQPVAQEQPPAQPSVAAEPPAQEPPAQAPPVQEAPPMQEAPVQEAPVPQAPVAAAPVAAVPAAGGAFDLAQLEAKWSDILGSLPGKARSRFSGGQLLSMDGGTLLFGLPNDIHRQRCVECVAEVQDAISTHMGAPVTLELTVDENAKPPARGGASLSSTPAPPPREPEAEDVVDLNALVDASEKEADGVNQLKSAFPGAELVEPEPQM